MNNRITPYHKSELASVSGPTLSGLNIEQRDNDIVVSADVEGVNEDDIRISLDRGILTISAEARHEQEDERDGWYSRTASYDQISRSVRLPEQVSADNVQAEIHDGKLTLVLPKVGDNSTASDAGKATNFSYRASELKR